MPTDGYDISIVQGGQQVDFDTPTLAVGVVTSAAVPFTPGPDGTCYTAYVRTRKASGQVGDAAWIPILMIASGGALVVRPNSPSELQAFVRGSGDVRLSWSLSDHQAAAITAFKVFGNNGSGHVDYTTPLATVGPYHRSAIVSGLATGVMHLLAVRAFAGTTHDGNMEAVLVVPRNDPPPAITSLAIDQV